jgi:hypothetical protein
MEISPNKGAIRLHILVAFKILAKCFSEELADELLKNYVCIENPLIGFVAFLKKSIVSFGVNHSRLFSQVKSLLVICGNPDPSHITFEKFSCFFSFLNCRGNMKKDWEVIQNNREQRDQNSVELSELLVICAEKRKPFLALLNLGHLSDTVIALNKMPLLMYHLYDDMVHRFHLIVTTVMPKLDAEIQKKVEDRLDAFKIALVMGHLARALWHYRWFLMRVDQLAMEAKGFIPLAGVPTDEQIGQMKEYYNRAESVAFAFVE